MAVTATEEDDESDGNDDVDTQGRRVQLSTKAKARPAQTSSLLRRLFDEKLQFWPKGPIIEKCDRGHPIISSQQSGGTEAESTQFASKRTFLFG